LAAAGKIQAAAGADQNPDSDGTLRCTELVDSGDNANGALVFSDSHENDLEQHSKAHCKEPECWSRCSGGSAQARNSRRETGV
jgi:hypothetical protein